MVPADDGPRPAARTGRAQYMGLATLTAYWLGLSVLWGALSTIVLPQLVEQLVPRGIKTSALALIVIMQAVVAIIVQPISGAASDELTSPWGRRRPLMVIGVAAQLVFLGLLVMAHAYVGVLAAMMLIEFASNTAQGPYQGLMPDVVQRGQRGAASGFLGASQLIGQIVGVVAAGIAVSAGNIELAVVFAGGAVALGMLVTVVGVDEPFGRSEQPLRLRRRIGEIAQPRQWVAPVRRVVVEAWGRDVLGHRDYLWLLGSRLAILAATGTLQPFVYYLLEDSLHLGPQASSAVAPLAGLVAIVALISAVPGGILSERIGRVRTVFLSAVLGALGALCFAVAPTYASLFVIAVPFGLAMGIFLSADWALMADLVPQDQTGRYLGLSNTVTAGASVVAVAIGGPLADLVNRVDYGLGYRAVFVFAAVAFVVGAWSVTHVGEPQSELA